MEIDQVKKLYLKKLLDQISIEESAKLDAFLAIHPASIDDLKAYAKQQVNSIKDYNANAALKKVKLAAKPSIIRPIFNVRNAAAAIILLVGSIALYINFRNSHNENWIQYTSSEKVGYKNIVLADGSKILLQNGSKLSVSPKFGKDNTRALKLDGQAFFEVTKDVSKPFIVTAHQSEVKVLGTSFNINTNESSSTVLVNTGKVKVKNIKTSNDIILSQNEGVVDNGLLMDKIILENKNYQAWFTGKFTFKESKLKDVVKDLNTFYKNNIVVKENFTSTCLLTADFDLQSLEEIIEVMNLSCGISFKKLGKQYQLE